MRDREVHLGVALTEPPPPAEAEKGWTEAGIRRLASGYRAGREAVGVTDAEEKAMRRKLEDVNERAVSKSMVAPNEALRSVSVVVPMNIRCM